MVVNTTRVQHPTVTDDETLTQVIELLRSHRKKPQDRQGLWLTDEEGLGRVELTAALSEALEQAALALRKVRARAVSVADSEIGTQEAAELLGISRPTVVALIERGTLHARIPGASRRRLLLSEVLDYRARLRWEQSQFIDESSAMYEPVENADELIAEARSRT